MPSETELVNRARGGDLVAYDDLVQRYQQRIYATDYHMTANHEDAKALAQEAFIKTFQQKEIPEEMPEFELQPGQTVLDVILAAKLAASKSEARRLFDQKGVRLDGETIERGDTAFPGPGVLQVGKRKFLRVK